MTMSNCCLYHVLYYSQLVSHLIECTYVHTGTHADVHTHTHTCTQLGFTQASNNTDILYSNGNTGSYNRPSVIWTQDNTEMYMY